ncbi:MAG: hypothetical protein ACYDA2_05150 [Acidimicrobiales bacterium]
MPEGPASQSRGAGAPRPGMWHRLLLALPRIRHDRDRAPLGERLRDAMLKPPDPNAPPAAGEARTVDELEAAVRYADDNERLIGLIAAPVAAALGVVVVSADIAHDQKFLANGHPNPHYTSVGIYHELLVVLLALALAMMAAAWFRKRLFVGVAMALYGITVFNLKYWGFGVPFAMGGAFFMVRAFRLNRTLREASGDLPGGSPRPSGRYTPPRRRPPPGR